MIAQYKRFILFIVFFVPMLTQLSVAQEGFPIFREAVTVAVIEVHASAARNVAEGVVPRLVGDQNVSTVW